MTLAKDLSILLAQQPDQPQRMKAPLRRGMPDTPEIREMLDQSVKASVIEDIHPMIGGLNYDNLKMGAQLQRDLTEPEKAALDYLASSASCVEGRDHYGIEGKFRAACRPQVVEALIRELRYKNETIEILNRRIAEFQGT